MQMQYVRNLISIIVLSTLLYSHCQVPCGIYNDALRIHQLREHITTIEKAIIQINALSAAESSALHNNQLVRWINTKEHHAKLIQDIVTDYFLAQRIKPQDADSPEWKKYVSMTTTLQQMLVAAMKCKQTVDSTRTESLSNLTAAFTDLYLDEHGFQHLQELKQNQ